MLASRWRSLVLPTAILLIAAGLAGAWMKWPWPGQGKPIARADGSHPIPLRAANAIEASRNPTDIIELPVTQSAMPDTRSVQEQLARSSLRGTQADGELRFDAAGRLLPDGGLRRLFDHFLTLSGEFSSAQIRMLVADSVAVKHGPDAAAQALDWFDRYTRLLRAVDAAVFPADPLARARKLHDLRQQHLGETAANAMFGEEEAALDLALARREITQATDLPAAERERLLDTLEATLPQELRDIAQAGAEAELAHAQTRGFDQDGTDAATRHAERAALWGEDAAERLAQLDARNADWQSRVDAYLDARTRLGDDEHALQLWMLTRFSEAERRRIAALEGIGALAPAPEDAP